MNDAPHTQGGESGQSSEYNYGAYGDASTHGYQRGPAPNSCGNCSQPPSRH